MAYWRFKLDMPPSSGGPQTEEEPEMTLAEEEPEMALAEEDPDFLEKLEDTHEQVRLFISQETNTPQFTLSQEHKNFIYKLLQKYYHNDIKYLVFDQMPPISELALETIEHFSIKVGSDLSLAIDLKYADAIEYVKESIPFSPTKYQQISDNIYQFLINNPSISAKKAALLAIESVAIESVALEQGLPESESESETDKPEPEVKELILHLNNLNIDTSPISSISNPELVIPTLIDIYDRQPPSDNPFKQAKKMIDSMHLKDIMDKSNYLTKTGIYSKTNGWNKLIKTLIPYDLDDFAISQIIKGKIYSSSHNAISQFISEYEKVKFTTPKQAINPVSEMSSTELDIPSDVTGSGLDILFNHFLRTQ